MHLPDISEQSAFYEMDIGMLNDFMSIAINFMDIMLFKAKNDIKTTYANDTNRTKFVGLIDGVRSMIDEYYQKYERKQDDNSKAAT